MSVVICQNLMLLFRCSGLTSAYIVTLGSSSDPSKLESAIAPGQTVNLWISKVPREAPSLSEV